MGGYPPKMRSILWIKWITLKRIVDFVHFAENGVGEKKLLTKWRWLRYPRASASVPEKTAYM